MADDPDHAAAGEAAAATDAGESPIINLPATVAPNINASQDEVKDTAPDEVAAAPTPARSRRFAMRAASVAVAAAFGSFVDTASGSGLARLIFPPPSPPAVGNENTLAAMREIKLELT